MIFKRCRMILKSNTNFKNIYLFASSDYNKNTKEKLQSLTLNDDDCVVLFNKPSGFVKNLLQDRPVDYCFARLFSSHLSNNKSAF